MPGISISDRYELIEVLGEGGFAVTWRAWDRRLERPVALKLLRPQFAADNQFVHRFEREARAAASVSHPNVVRLFDYGADGDSVFIVMQYVQGSTLRDTLRSRPSGLMEDHAVAIMLAVLQGLEAVHRAGIVHRDLKPDNILIGRDGQVLITDFGIALLGDTVRLTTAETTFGTAAYMAPEQARGESVASASDLYSAGVVLFEMLTGRLPFGADTAVAMLMAHQELAPPSPQIMAPANHISVRLDGCVLRAMAKQPADRFHSARDFLAAVQGDISHSRSVSGALKAPTLPMQVPVSRASATVPYVPPTRRRRVRLRLYFVIALALIGISAIAGQAWFDSSPAVRPTATSAPAVNNSDEQPTIAGINVDPTVSDTPVDVLSDQPNVIVSEVPEGGDDQATIVPED